MPEVCLDYEISDSEEIYDEESNDKQIYSNRMSPGYKSAKDDSYTDSVYQYKYSTSPSRLDRFLRREIYANKKEHELFSKNRIQDDLTSASKINISDKRLKDKLWRHPDFFGFKKSKSSSKTPKEDFFKRYGEDAKTELKEHLVSSHTRCFKNGLYREHQESYDYYYNNQTGKLLLIKNNVDTGEQEIFSFWTISKMQRLELLNHNHVHKHWKLVEALRKKNVEEKALVKAQIAQKRKENRLNEVLSPAEAARRAGEYIKKKHGKQIMTFSKKNCLKLLKYEKLVTEKFQQTLGEYDSEKYFELQNQLSYVKDFIIWKQSFSQYFKLFTNFKNELIDGERFVDEFFDIFNEDKELLKNFVFNSESLKKLNINPKSSRLVLFLEEISMKCDLFQDDSDIILAGEIDEDQLRSYIKQIYTDLESFN